MKDKIKRAWWVVRDVMQPTVTGVKASWARLRNWTRPDLVLPEYACPECGERRRHCLEHWATTDWFCLTCETAYIVGPAGTLVI